MATKKASGENHPREIQQQGSTLAAISPSSPPISNAYNAVRLFGSMRCEATFQENMISKKCYATDRNINLVGLD
ncbi:hypothetical protein ACTXT7_001670 [Hymenolepis weldensis]